MYYIINLNDDNRHMHHARPFTARTRFWPFNRTHPPPPLTFTRTTALRSLPRDTLAPPAEVMGLWIYLPFYDATSLIILARSS